MNNYIKLMQKKNHKNSKHDIHLTNVIFFASKTKKKATTLMSQTDKSTIFNTQIIYIRIKHPDDFFVCDSIEFYIEICILNGKICIFYLRIVNVCVKKKKLK